MRVGEGLARKVISAYMATGKFEFLPDWNYEKAAASLAKNCSKNIPESGKQFIIELAEGDENA